MEEKRPFEDVWQGIVKAGEEKQINLEVQDKQYVQTGPWLPDKPFSVQWKGESMVYALGGTSGM